MFNNAPPLVQAKELIQSVKGKKQTVNERVENSIILANWILKEAQSNRTSAEIDTQEQLARLMDDPKGKAFLTAMTDQCFRSRQNSRVANQLTYLINKFGTPQFLTQKEKIGMRLFKVLGSTFTPLLVPILKRMMRKATDIVILPGEPNKLKSHLKRRHEENVSLNVNLLGEAILGERESSHRIQKYIDDLANPLIKCISVKISTIHSQISLLAWKDTLEVLATRLRLLYRAAKENSKGQNEQKFVYLDMEEYRDLNLTVALFQKLLDEDEFLDFSAGIALQAYIPESYSIQTALTEWAIKRCSNGGVPIKIRLVKGANLAMEQIEASMRNWPQAPYPSKHDVDSNFKRMLEYGCEPKNAEAVHIGVASHNLFDVSNAILLRAENDVEEYVSFEMLEGMADHIRRVVQNITNSMLLYCPIAKKEEFEYAIAYLLRRLDENTAPENFLREMFHLQPGNKEWDKQAELFKKAFYDKNVVSNAPRRMQNREISEHIIPSTFQNEPDTDWTIENNRKWIFKILEEWKNADPIKIPLVINETERFNDRSLQKQKDPSYPHHIVHTYAKANLPEIKDAVTCARNAADEWKKSSSEERSHLLNKIAAGISAKRGRLIAAMMADTAKTIQESDTEISEAIDFATYYSEQIRNWYSLPDIYWIPKGVVLVAPPWNFPCSIPAGGILAALATGNSVIFKPAPEAVLVGWELANIFWEAGVSKRLLQFVNGDDETIGTALIRNTGINMVVLTGATSTAKHLLQLRPGLDLSAETGGKNSIIISNMADRDLAIKDLLQSAFSHSGQKCSACSLAILHAELYDDKKFLDQLQDAAKSLSVGTPWQPATKINPLIRAPNQALMHGLTKLEKGEWWLVEPKEHRDNPNLWSPGIKMGVKIGSFTQRTELFGPVLGVMRANTIDEAIKLANSTQYGLTAGIHTLDEREQQQWLQTIEAGNLYINRTITGAIVQRQPFGGCKQSSFGYGFKAGGPNYLTQFMIPRHIDINPHDEEIHDRLKLLMDLASVNLNTVELEDLANALKNYTYYYNNYFTKQHDPSLVLGEDNYLKYVPHKLTTIRIQSADSSLQVFKTLGAAILSNGRLRISGEDNEINSIINQLDYLECSIHEEEEREFIEILRHDNLNRVRILSPCSDEILQVCALKGISLLRQPVVNNGRLELLNYLREVSVSKAYHRYGNLGIREGEIRNLHKSYGNDHKPQSTSNRSS